MKNIEQVVGDVGEFLDKVHANLEDLGIDVLDYPIDHIAYRAVTRESYDDLKKQLLEYGAIFSEVMIRERPVAIIKLDIPLKYKQREIIYFELSAPAVGDTFEQGLEHAEFVVDVPLAEFLEKYPKVDFITKSLDKKINPDLALKFRNNANVKFHEMPIDEVIELERRLAAESS